MELRIDPELVFLIENERSIDEHTVEIDEKTSQANGKYHKWRSNLSEEKVSTLKEKNRAYYKKLNEEQRAVKRERNRLYRLNRSEEKRQAELEKKRQMSKEERKVMRDRYLKKLSEDQLVSMRRKKADYLRMVRANWSEEQKEAEKKRKRLWASTRRDRTAEYERTRLQRQNMTKEQRVALKTKWKEEHRKAAEKKRLQTAKEPSKRMTDEKHKVKRKGIGKRRMKTKLTFEQEVQAMTNNGENLTKATNNDENLNSKQYKNETLPLNKMLKTKRKALSSNNEEDLNVIHSKPKKKTWALKIALKTKRKGMSANNKVQPKPDQTKILECKVVLEQSEVVNKLLKKVKKTPTNEQWSVIKPNTKKSTLVIKIAKSKTKQKQKKKLKDKQKSASDMKNCSVLLKRLSNKVIEQWLKGQAKRVQWKLTPTFCNATSKPKVVINGNHTVGIVKCVPLSILIKREPQQKSRENDQVIEKPLFVKEEEDDEKKRCKLELPLEFDTDPIEKDPLLQDEIAVKPNRAVHVTHNML